MKKWRGVKHFDDDEGRQNAVADWLHSQAAEFNAERWNVMSAWI